MLGDAAMLVGSWIYGAYLTATPLRSLFLVLQLLNAAASTFNLMLATGAHVAMSVPARVFAPLGNVFFWLAWQCVAQPPIATPSMSLTDCSCVSG